jgi:hypothetical protein
MKPVYSRLLGGVFYPVVVLVVGMLLLANVDSAAHAAEFAALGVFFMLLVALPITIVGNFILLRPNGNTLDHFKRGMILPAFFILCAIIYQTGLWDQLT